MEGERERGSLEGSGLGGARHLRVGGREGIQIREGGWDFAMEGERSGHGRRKGEGVIRGEWLGGLGAHGQRGGGGKGNTELGGGWDFGMERGRGVCMVGEREEGVIRGSGWGGGAVIAE